MAKPRSGSTAPSLGTRSRTWPYEARTWKSLPRYLLIVLALAGDSTMRRCLGIGDWVPGAASGRAARASEEHDARAEARACWRVPGGAGTPYIVESRAVQPCQAWRPGPGPGSAGHGRDRDGGEDPHQRQGDQ